MLPAPQDESSFTEVFRSRCLYLTSKLFFINICKINLSLQLYTIAWHPRIFNLRYQEFNIYITKTRLFFIKKEWWKNNNEDSIQQTRIKLYNNISDFCSLSFFFVILNSSLAAYSFLLIFFIYQFPFWMSWCQVSVCQTCKSRRHSVGNLNSAQHRHHKFVCNRYLICIEQAHIMNGTL